MNNRIIPLIVLIINLLFFISGQYLLEISFSPLLVVWNVVSLFCLVAVAYWIYEDGKRIDFLEENLSKKLNKLEWIMESNYKRMEERSEK